MRQEWRAGKAIHSQLHAVLGLDAKVGSALPKAVVGRPRGSVGTPRYRKVFEDQSGARKVAGRTNYFGAGPLMRCHDAGAVEDILNGVLRLVFFDDGTRWDTLRDGELCHDVCLDELVVSWAAGEYEVGSDAGFELTNAFEGAFALFRRRCSIRVGRCAEDDDGVEVREVGVVGRDRPIEEDGTGYCEDHQSEDDRQ